MERVPPQRSGPPLAWLIAAAIAVTIGILAIVLVNNQRDVAIDPDTGVPEIDAWIAARNTADLEALRALTDPDSPYVAWVFTAEVGGLEVLRLLGQSDILTECHVTGDAGVIGCYRDSRWILGDVVEVAEAQRAWTVGLSNGLVTSYEEAPRGGRPSVSGAPDVLLKQLSLYLAWVGVVRPEEGRNIDALDRWRCQLIQQCLDDAPWRSRSVTQAGVQLLL